MISIVKLLQNTRIVLKPRITSFAASFNIQSANLQTKTLEEKLGIPVRPKKPLTPFFRFLNHARAQTPKAKDMPSTDFIRQLAKKWQTVDETLKKKFTEEYLKERAEFTKKISFYESKLTPTQKEEIRAAKEEKAAVKEKRVHKKKIRDHNRPKKPMTGYLRYLLDNQKGREGLSRDDFMRRVAEDWRQLPEAKRVEYNNLSKAEFVKYNKDILKWEREMIKLGNLDLVRKEALIEHEPKPKGSGRAKAD